MENVSQGSALGTVEGQSSAQLEVLRKVWLRRAIFFAGSDGCSPCVVSSNVVAANSWFLVCYAHTFL